jgi:hypothetical protein
MDAIEALVLSFMLAGLAGVLLERFFRDPPQQGQWPEDDPLIAHEPPADKGDASDLMPTPRP